MKFVVVHSLAFLSALAAFALYIVSFNTAFYSLNKEYVTVASDLTSAISTNTRVNLTTTSYGVYGIVRSFAFGPKDYKYISPVTISWSQGDVSGPVRQVFYIIYIFLVLGILSVSILLVILLGLFFRSFQIKTLALPQKVYRFFLFSLAFLSFTGAFIAFFELRAMPGALDQSESTSTACTAGYCKSFSGSTSDVQTGLTYNVNWGPEAGWYTSLAAFLVSIPLAFIVLINRVPLLEVTDDVTSGYAL